MREQFLVEVADTTAEQLAERGLSPAAALLELNGLFTAWVETGLPPPGAFRDRADTRWPVGTTGWDGRRARPGDARGGGVDRGVPVVRSGAPSPRPRRCRCTATPTRSNPPWPAGRSSWCSPRSTSNTSTIRYAGQQLRNGAAAQHHPPRPPQSPTRDTRTGTGTGDRDRLPDHGRRRPPPAGRRRGTINFHALYSTEQQPAPDSPQLPGQLSTASSHDDALHRRRPHDGTDDPAGEQGGRPRA